MWLRSSEQAFSRHEERHSEALPESAIWLILPLCSSIAYITTSGQDNGRCDYLSQVRPDSHILCISLLYYMFDTYDSRKDGLFSLADSV